MSYLVSIDMDGHRRPIFILTKAKNQRQAVGDAMIKLIRTCRVREIHAINVTRSGGMPDGALTLRDLKPAAEPAAAEPSAAPARRQRRTWKSRHLDAASAAPEPLVAAPEPEPVASAPEPLAASLGVQPADIAAVVRATIHSLVWPPKNRSL